MAYSSMRNAMRSIAGEVSSIGAIATGVALALVTTTASTIPRSIATTREEEWTAATSRKKVHASTAYTSRCESPSPPNNVGDNSTAPAKKYLEAHFMDKIQQKPYLQTANKEGIPPTLRILAIDLTDLRHSLARGTTCQVAHDKIFDLGDPDYPPPKVVRKGRPIASSASSDKRETNQQSQRRPEESSKRKRKLRIPQKTLVKSLLQCSSSQSQQTVGIEVLEASVADLNPYQLRKTHQIGKWKYDPGKYYGKDHNNKKDSEGPVIATSINSDEELAGPTEAQDSYMNPDDDHHLSPRQKEEQEIDREREAPWNQYAWQEEMKLRINGQVEFDGTLEKSRRWNRMVLGQVYKVTIPTKRHRWEFLFPQFAKSDPNGIDSRIKTNCRACNKPHAVIANGAALQQVPSSLRLLQKLCRKANIPLFVIHDPRSWGGNTHQTLEEALQEMRGVIKGRIIEDALKQQGSSSFRRGRMLGRVETEAKWQAKETKRKAKNLFVVDERVRRRKTEDKNWSQLDSAALEKKLVEKGVIQKQKDTGGKEKKHYNPAMTHLSAKCVEHNDDEAKRQ